jgi:hypothetical protein
MTWGIGERDFFFGEVFVQTGEALKGGGEWESMGGFPFIVEREGEGNRGRGEGEEEGTFRFNRSSSGKLGHAGRVGEHGQARRGGGWETSLPGGTTITGEDNRLGEGGGTMRGSTITRDTFYSPFSEPRETEKGKMSFLPEFGASLMGPWLLAGSPSVGRMIFSLIPSTETTSIVLFIPMIDFDFKVLKTFWVGGVG